MSKFLGRLFMDFDAKVQTILLIATLILPYAFWKTSEELVVKMKGDIIEGIEISIENFPEVWISIITGIILCGLLCMYFRQRNGEITFNKGNAYKTQTYIWYFYCANILGYRKCILERVPIAQQIRLVLNDTFEEFVFSKLEEREDIEIKAKWKIALNAPYQREINLMLADTYPLELEQITVGRNLPTLLIDRKNRRDNNRYYIPDYCKVIAEELEKLPLEVEVINLYATTNVKHVKEFTEKVLKKGGRGNIKMLRVYQQDSTRERKFGKKAKVIKL